MKCDAIIPLQTSLWVTAAPFLLWEIGHRLMVEHWMENLFRTNAELSLWLEAPNEQLFSFVTDTFPLNRRVQVQVGVPKTQPEACTFFDSKGNVVVRRGPRLTSYLPRQPLTKTWFEVVRRWLAELHTSGTQVPELEKQIAPGVFVGHHCSISRDTKFIAPCWVGTGVTISGATIGPNAVVGEGAVVTRGTRLTESYVLSHCIAGPDLPMNGLVVGPASSMVITTGEFVDRRTGLPESGADTQARPSSPQQPRTNP